MYSVRIGFQSYEVILMFRGEKEARDEYDIAYSFFGRKERRFLKDGFKRETRVDFTHAVCVTLTDEEAAAMARAELQLIDARANLNAQKRFQAENPARALQVPRGMNQ